MTKSGRTSIRCGVDDPEGGCYCFTVFPNEWQPPHPTLPRVFIITLHYRSRDSVVDIAFRLRTGRSGVSIPAGPGSFYHPQNVQTGCGTHPAFCSITIRVLSPGEAVHSHLFSSCMPSWPDEGQLYFLPPVLNIRFNWHKVGCKRLERQWRGKFVLKICACPGVDVLLPQKCALYSPTVGQVVINVWSVRLFLRKYIAFFILNILKNMFIWKVGITVFLNQWSTNCA